MGVARFQLNTYASRRGNHEVMMRGCFANVRLRNQLVPGVEDGYTRNLFTDEVTRSMTSRRPIGRVRCRWSSLRARSTAADRRATGPRRARLAGCSRCPCRVLRADTPVELHRDGDPPAAVRGWSERADSGSGGDGDDHDHRARGSGRWPYSEFADVRAGDIEFRMRVRLDTARDGQYYRHGGITKYVIRQILRGD